MNEVLTARSKTINHDLFNITKIPTNKSSTPANKDVVYTTYHTSHTKQLQGAHILISPTST